MIQMKDQNYNQNLIYNSNLQINDMKKYSSYIDLKLAINPKQQSIKSPKHTGPSCFKRVIALQSPTTPVIKELVPSSSKGKYSAAYLQRKKIFSNKKQNKDTENTKYSGKEISKDNLKQKISNLQKKVEEVKKNNESRPKKHKQEKKEKMVKNKQALEIETKQLKQKYRFDIQSPKAQFGKEEKKQKPKEKQKQKSGVLRQLNKEMKKTKKDMDLKQYVTSYEIDKKEMLIQCTSQSNLIKPSLLQKNKQKNFKQDYYVHCVFSAFFSGSKPSSFQQICKNHLYTSIDFLSFIRKNKRIIPSKYKTIALPPTKLQTLVFDLDETLIHCNQSLDLPYDAALPITFPNGQTIKAGINIRQYATECIKQLSKYFELILFTASHECYANVIVDHLDPKNQYFSYRFFRQSCYKTQQGFYVKDLRVLDRNLQNVLLIDNAAYSYCFQPENGVPIIPFYNNKTDFELKSLTSYLREFKGVRDMRVKNENYMRLSEYHKFKNPKQLINQLYM